MHLHRLLPFQFMKAILVGFICFGTLVPLTTTSVVAQDPPPDIEIPEEFANFGEDSDFGAIPLSEEEEATANYIRNGIIVGGAVVVLLIVVMILRKKWAKKAPSDPESA